MSQFFNIRHLIKKYNLNLQFEIPKHYTDFIWTLIVVFKILFKSILIFNHQNVVIIFAVIHFKDY